MTTDIMKLELLKKYAPYVWLANKQALPHTTNPIPMSFFPSSVEFAFDQCNRTQIDGKYWLTTKESITKESITSTKILSLLPYFDGQDPTQNNVPVYAFWVDGSVVNRMVYFFFYPFNYGKFVVGDVYGNHVGDWESIYIDLKQDANSADGLSPYKISLSQHDGGKTYFWDDPRITFTNGHPVVYSAWGSHATYINKGEHKYKDIVVADLVDSCSEGVRWDTSNNLISYNYSTRQPLGTNPWPNWMSDEFSSSGAIYRWGNQEWGRLPAPISQCILENGPMGPVSKPYWNNLPDFDPALPQPSKAYGPYRLNEEIYIIDPWGYMRGIPSMDTYRALFGDFDAKSFDTIVAKGLPITNGILIQSGAAIFFCYDVASLPDGKRGYSHLIPNPTILKQYCFNRGTYYKNGQGGVDLNNYCPSNNWEKART